MGGIIGRLFREFAVTLSMAIVVSAFVALTLTPMMASRFLRPPKEAHHGRLYACSERGSTRSLHAYERGLDIVLRHQFITLCVFFATLALSVYLFVIIPKGFFPQQDTGLLTGISEAAQETSPDEMMQHQQAARGDRRERSRGRPRRHGHGRAGHIRSTTAACSSR